MQPKHWQSYIIHYRYRDTYYHITIEISNKKIENSISVTIDNVLKNTTIVSQGDSMSCTIPMVNDWQDHFVKVDC